MKLGKRLQIVDDDEFQLLLKGCTIEAVQSVLIEAVDEKFQLLLKGCTIEAPKPTD